MSEMTMTNWNEWMPLYTPLSSNNNIADQFNTLFRRLEVVVAEGEGEGE